MSYDKLWTSRSLDFKRDGCHCLCSWTIIGYRKEWSFSWPPVKEIPVTLVRLSSIALDMATPVRTKERKVEGILSEKMAYCHAIELFDEVRK